jgi:MoaA/NifB/PqqE/SkfB family radical SAM enzyme
MVRGFYIEPTNICTLKCSGCARTRFIDQWPQHWKNHSLDIDQLLNFLDVDLKNKSISLGGNYGDPIYHPDFINFIRRLKQAGATIHIGTNGSYKTKEWWQQLTDLLEATDRIIFAIDGIPENFKQYRKNADWDSIEIGIKTSVASRCQTTWKYIPFSFNENDIDSARTMSNEFGIDVFTVEPSDRYDKLTAGLIPTKIDFIGKKFNAQQNFKKVQQIVNLAPKCNNDREHYISAEGFYSPCCRVADHRFYYKTNFGKQKKQYDIRNTTLSQLLEKDNVIEFYNNLEQHSVCQYSCPEITT